MRYSSVLRLIISSFAFSILLLWVYAQQTGRKAADTTDALQIPITVTALSQACFKATQQITDGVRLTPDPDSVRLPMRQQHVRQVRLTFSDKEHEWGMTRILTCYIPKEPADSSQK